MHTQQFTGPAMWAAEHASHSEVDCVGWGVPVTRRPCTRPISTPLRRGDTPILYAGRLDRNPATRGDEVTGVCTEGSRVNDMELHLQVEMHIYDGMTDCGLPRISAVVPRLDTILIFDLEGNEKVIRSAIPPAFQ